ncbi:MAG: ABC transporter permease [Myxococcota bacterium]|nr:ABC transporter permease [Myxococcota bacterium]
MTQLVRRLGWSLAVLWAVVSLSFAINALLPGDPARMAAGPQARPADVARIREQLGLDKPPIVQYAIFWRRLVHVAPRTMAAAPPPPHADCANLVTLVGFSLHVNLGRSYQLRQPVVLVVAGRLPRTLALAISAVLVQLALGLMLGVAAALRRESIVDRILVNASLIGVSMPTFLIALGLQYLFGYELGWLPLDGFGSSFVGHVLALAMPALTLGIYGAAYYTRLVRDEMIVALQQDWVRAARAKGASALRVVSYHGLRNVLVPVVTAVGVDFGTLMGGAMVTETVFRWPGLGELSVRAMLNRDGPVIVGCVMVTAFAVVASNLVVDLMYVRLDPRAR